MTAEYELPLCSGYHFIHVIVCVLARSHVDVLGAVTKTSLAVDEGPAFGPGMTGSCGRRGGLMVSALVSGASGPGLSPGRGHGVVFLGKTPNSHSGSLHPGV